MNQEALYNQDISFIEKFYSEEMILQSEHLLEQNSINAIPKSDHLWDITVADQSFHYQLTITIKGDTIRNYQCNCNPYLSGNLCNHIAAAILYIRAKKQELLEQKSKKRRASIRITKIKDIVNKMTPEEMNQLITDYTKRDDLFKLVIYARKYDMLNESEKQNIIERSFPAHTQIGQKVTAKSLNSFLAICEELKAQYSKLISLENFREAFTLILLLLKKSFYIKSKMTTDHKGFNTNHNKLLENYYEIIEIIEAPEFKFLALDKTLELLNSSYISMQTEAEQNLWINIYNKPSHHPQLLEITSKYLSIGKSEDLKSYYFILSLQLLLNKDRGADRLLEIDAQQSYRIIQVLLQIQHVDGVKNLLKDIILTKKANNFLALQILGSMPSNYYDDNLRDAVIKLYISSGNTKFLDYIIFKEGENSDSKSYLEKRLKEHADPDNLINYYIQENRDTEAIVQLQDHLKMDRLMKFDAIFHNNHPEAILDMYKELCDDYMESHFGPQSRAYLLNIYQHLEKIGAIKIKNALIQHIQSEFAKRKSLAKI